VKLPHHFEQTIMLVARAEAVFERLDDFERLGAHMMRSNWMMAGSRMRYDFDRARGRKLGACVRLSGSILGLKLQIEEQVVEYAPPLRKVWQTIGAPRMLIIDAYRMGFVLTPSGAGSLLQVFIDYALPEAGGRRLLSLLLGAVYARWCVKLMISDAARAFDKQPGVLASSATGRV